MKRSEIHQQIEQILERIQTNNRNLSVQISKISQLETDLMRKQCIELYDLINQLHIANVLEKPLNVHENLVTPPIEKTDKNLITEPASSPEYESKIENKEVSEIPVILLDPEPELAPLEVVKPVDLSNQVENNPILTSENAIIEQEKSPKEPEVLLDDQITKHEGETDSAVEVVKPFTAEKPSVEMVSDLKRKLENPVFDVPKFVPIAEKQPPVITPPKKVVVEERSVLERISEQQIDKSIHKNISFGKNETELFHDFANSKISKIKDAIDISKRFEIQTRLFGEDSNAYNISINELENAGTHDGALNLFQTFAKRYHWDSEDELVNELKSFIYRKYRDS